MKATQPSAFPIYRNLEDSERHEEHLFWTRLRNAVLGRDVHVGLAGDELSMRLRRLRNWCLAGLLLFNGVWLVLLSLLYYYNPGNADNLNMYGLIAGGVYGLALLVQLVGMLVHRIQAVFSRFAKNVFGPDTPVWVHSRIR